MNIAVESPPASLPVDAQEYLNRVIIGFAGSIANLELEIQRLSERVKQLEDS